MNAISITDYKNLVHEIHYDFQFFTITSMTENLQEQAISLIDKYQLKTLDSIQLASIIVLEKKVDYFIASDRRLLKAAISENLNTLDPANT